MAAGYGLLASAETVAQSQLTRPRTALPHLANPSSPAGTRAKPGIQSRNMLSALLG